MTAYGLSLGEARRIVMQMFQKKALWAPPDFVSYLSPSKGEDAQELDDTSHAILHLLEAYPALASERFHNAALVDYDEDYNGEGCHPLTFFVWRNLNTKLLSRIFRLYPRAMSEPQLHCPNLLEMECRLFFASDTTLSWLIARADFLEESVIYRIVLFRNLLPLEDIKEMLGKAPDLEIDESGNQLVNVLLARGYEEDVVAWVIDFMGCSVLTLSTEAISWEVDSCKAKIIISLLPKVKVLRLESLLWTSGGWNMILRALPQCTTLGAVLLQLPFGVLLETREALDSLQFFLGQRASYKLSLLLMGNAVHPFPANYNHKRFRKKTTRVLQTLMNGLKANPESKRTLDLLELRNVVVSSQMLARLEQFAASMRLEEVGILGSKSHKEQQGWGLGGTDNCLDKQTELWDAIGTLDLRGGYAIERHFPLYESLHICTSWPDAMPQPDISDMLITLLTYDPLKEVVLELPMHSFDTKAVCRVLKENNSLQKLSLMGLHLRHEEAKAVPACFLQIFQEKNVSLQFLKILNQQNEAITLGAALTQSHVDVCCAEQIQYLLSLNRCGRSEVRNLTTSMERIFAMLRQAQKQPEGKRWFWDNCTLEDLQLTETELTSDPLAQSSIFYEKLRKNVRGWCRTRRQGASQQSMLYGLLRESPDLWCPRHIE